MRKLFYPLILCSFLLLFSTGLSRATMMAGGGTENEQFSGKLIAISTLSDRYKLRIDKRILFIMKNKDKHSKDMIKAAKSLLHKKVTVTYKAAGNIILSITPLNLQKETFH